MHALVLDGLIYLVSSDKDEYALLDVCEELDHEILEFMKENPGIFFWIGRGTRHPSSLTQKKKCIF